MSGPRDQGAAQSRRPRWSRIRTSRGASSLIAALIAFGAPSVALAAFPGTDPNESVRANAPNDPGYDACEPDN